MRAISRFASFRRALFSSAPVADWKRRLNSSCRRSCNASASSSSVMSLRSLAFKEIRLPLHELRLQRQLRPGQAQRFLRELLGHTGELEHHAARLDHRDPVLRRALARAHARLGRLLRRRLVGEDVDPDLAAALDLARHRDSRGLDLPVGDPPGLERLQAEVAELHGRLALRVAAPAASLILAELRLLREEHLLVSLLLLRGVFGLLLRCRAVGRVCDRCRSRLDVRLDLRLLAALRRLRLLIGLRPLDVVLGTGAVARSASAPATALAATATTLTPTALAAAATP